MFKALSETTLPFKRKPNRHNRQNHQHIFQQLHTRTDTYKYSFVRNTILDWNGLPKTTFDNCKIAPEQLEGFSNYVRKCNN